jgi:hypothetical protein
MHPINKMKKISFYVVAVLALFLFPVIVGEVHFVLPSMTLSTSAPLSSLPRQPFYLVVFETRLHGGFANSAIFAQRQGWNINVRASPLALPPTSKS